MTEAFELYESVKIVGTGQTGVIVAIDDDGGTKPPIYFVEKDDKFKTGNDDLIWLENNEIERI
ncbi:MAG: hypothetical protein LIO62_02935 [Clostridiales bacterium]|nr:hypothetical protein [Clostridiales bacterium]